MPLNQGGPHERGGETGAPPLKRRYYAVTGSFNVKMVADTCRHRHIAYHNKHWRRAS